MGSHITLMLKQGLLRPSPRDEFSTEPIKATVDFSSGNQLYKNDNKSLDQLDTFITADAWYRQRVFSRMVRLGQLQLKRTNVHS